jgi:predicted nucleotidyltransferase
MYGSDMLPGESPKINVEKLDMNLRQAFGELATALIKKYRNQVLSIVVFGSATTCDWIRGKSDVDFIIVTDGKESRKEVENFANNLLIRLSTKYDLRLAQTCSAFRRTRNPALKAIFAVESFMTFGKPFFVLSKDQIETDRGKIRDARIKLVTSIFDSIAIFATKIKQTGSTIYGEDMLKEFYVNRSTTEKIKTLMAPLWLTLMSFFIFPIDAGMSLDHSVKATLWACEDALFYLDQDLSLINHEIRVLQNIFSDCRHIRFDHVELALRKRQELRKRMKTGKGLAALFLFQTLLFVIALYHCAATLARMTSPPRTARS